MPTKTLSTSAWRTLDAIDEQVALMFAMLQDGVAAVTAAFLECDRHAARAVAAGDQLIDLLQEAIEESVEAQLATALPSEDADLARLVSVLLVAAQLERAGDLLAEIAFCAGQGLARVITAVARDEVAEVGRLVTELWSGAAAAYLEGDCGVAAHLGVLARRVDDLHDDIANELSSVAVSTVAVADMKQVAALYERLARHALHVAARAGAKA